MNDRPKAPPGFRDATATGATLAVIGIGPPSRPREPDKPD